MPQEMQVWGHSKRAESQTDLKMIQQHLEYPGDQFLERSSAGTWSVTWWVSASSRSLVKHYMIYINTMYEKYV